MPVRYELRPYQTEALDRIAAAEKRGVRRQLISAATGLGKAQPVDEPVLTPDGWRKIGDLRVGDFVIGSDGCPTIIEGVYPQGRRRIFRVTTDDGAWTRVDADHLWTVATDSDITRGRTWRTLTTLELLTRGIASPEGRRRWRLPLVSPVEGRGLPLPMPAYTLGVLLGDGCLTIASNVTFASNDPQIAELVRSDLDGYNDCRVVEIQNGDRCPAYRIASDIGARANPTTVALRSLDLMGHGAASKFVPDRYMTADVEDRHAVLQGLLDTDGWVGDVVQFTTVSTELAGNVIELVRSLGGVARLSGKIPTYRDRDGERRAGQWAHTITLRLPAHLPPFRLDRKHTVWAAKNRLAPTRKVALIEPDGEDDAVCIAVAAPDSLYVTRGHIVTHNTIMFCALAQQRGGRALILAHRDELVAQAAQKISEIWPDVSVGIVKAERNDVTADVVVASVQTLARPARLAKLIAPFGPDAGLLLRARPFELVVVDEAHHTAADSYRAILDALHAGEKCDACGGTGTYEEIIGSPRGNPPERVLEQCERCRGIGGGPLLLGVTATPDRGDGKGLDDLFDEIVASYDILWGIAHRYLSDLRGLRVEVSALDLDRIKVRQGDYDQGQVGRAMEAAGASKIVASAWQKHAEGRRTLVFTPTVEVARLVAEEFLNRGVRAAFVSGQTPLEERRSTLRMYANGELDVVANCAVLTEGYDEPRTDCIIVARPTKSRALYTQMVGRGTRRHPEKTDCLVLDVVGASKEHSLVTIPSLFGLPEKFARKLGDGTGLLSGVVDEHASELVRIGRLRSEEAELFHSIRSDGIAWVPLHRPGDKLKRYFRSLGKDATGAPLPMVVLAQRTAETWTAGLQWPNGEKRVLLAEVDQGMAQGVAEDYVRKNTINAALVSTKAQWRKNKPSEKQVAAAKKWRLRIDDSWDSGQLSDALDAHIARIRDRKDRAKATR